MSAPAFISLVQKEVSKADIKFLNRGGCGIFAYYVSLHMNALGIPHKVIAMDNWRTPKDWNTEKTSFFNNVVNNKEADNSGQLALTCSHISIKYCRNYSFDSEMEFKIKRTIIEGKRAVNKDWCKNYRVVGEYSKQMLKAAIQLENGWNDEYKREQNPILFKAIRSAYQKYRQKFLAI